MRPFQKAFLIFLSLWLILLLGCRQTTFTTVGMVELPQVKLPVDEKIDKISYRMDLETKRGRFSGILVIKRMADETRLAFFSEVGMSYFEASLQGAFPCTLVMRSINPLISSSKTTGQLETAMNLLLVKRYDMRSGEVYRDEEMYYWTVGLAGDGSEYWAKLDEEGYIIRAYLDDDKPLTATFSYPGSESGYPSRIEYFDRRERLVITLVEI